MKSIITSASFILVIVFITFPDILKLDQHPDTAILSEEQYCNTDPSKETAFTADVLIDVVKKLQDFKLNHSNTPEKKDSCNTKNMVSMTKKIIKNNFSIPQLDSSRVVALKKILIPKN